MAKDEASLDFARLSSDADGHTIEGTIVGVEEGRPFRVTYVVRCDSAWRTREARVSVDDGGTAREVVVRANDDGSWSVNGKPARELQSCTDIDLEGTPATNTLPIRRLDWRAEARRDVHTAWVRFPSLHVERAVQTYTRLEPGRFLFESRAFRAHVEVDDDGLVVDYEGVWKRA